MNDNKPFFSVIVPCYNVENYLRICIESIIHQSYHQFELILVDDGSTDTSGEICDSYAIMDDRIIVIHQENGGVSMARNTGINKAIGKWIIFIDPDDWIELTAFEKLHKIIIKTEADIYFFDYYQEYAKKQINKHLLDKSCYMDANIIKAIRLAPFNQLILNGKMKEYETNVVWNKVYKTEVLKYSGLHFIIEARKGQDVIFNAEAFQLFNKFYYIHETLYHYRYLESSITNRYNPKVKHYNEVAFSQQERIIHQYDLTCDYVDNYRVRVLTRLYSCLRLYYFHESNTMTWKTIKNELQHILSSEPYQTAMLEVKPQCLHGGQKLFVECLKRKQFRVLKFLVSSRAFLQKIKRKNLG